MPRKTEWTHRLPRALAELRALPAPAIDRAALQRLLGVSARQALRIMHQLRPCLAGKSLVILRDDLIRQLEAAEANSGVRIERQRLERVTVELERTRLQLAARQIQVPVAAHAPAWPMLPDGIRLEPGRLEIRFASGEQLLGMLLELAHAVADDPDQFQAAISGGAD